MKKFIVLMMVLMLMLSVALTGCGSSAVDPEAEAIASNNAYMQAKFDEFTSLGMDLANTYLENAEVLGYTQEEMQVIYDKVISQIETANGNHQTILDGGGYDAETLAQMETVVDAGIAGYNESHDALTAALESVGIVAE